MPYKNKEDTNRNHREQYWRNIEHQREIHKIARRKRLNNPVIRKVERKKWREYWRGIRYEILAHYSGEQPKCAHCGFSDIRALCIDHIYNDGYEERKKIGWSNTKFYSIIKKNNFPPRYQVLCHNCNFIKMLERKEVERNNGK